MCLSVCLGLINVLHLYVVIQKKAKKADSIPEALHCQATTINLCQVTFGELQSV